MIDLYRGTAPEAEPKPHEPRGEATERRCRWWLFSWPCAAPEAPAAVSGRDAASYARTAANELELLFPRLPNPDVFIYVLPHLATEARVPVPGYTTAVPLYERVEYALPDELEQAVRLLEPGPGGMPDGTDGSRSGEDSEGGDAP